MRLYLPATQAEQAPFVPVHPALHLHALRDTPATGRSEFAGQRTHTILLSSEYEPAAQSLHVSVDALGTSEYFPGAQSVHAADPFMSLYLPATQARQSSFVPVQPGLQMHAVSDTLATCEWEFGGQSRQTNRVSVEYEPAAQSLHVSVDALTMTEYFPGAQSVHATDPIISLYLPATHAEQSPFVCIHPALQLQSVIAVLALEDMELGGQSMHCSGPGAGLYFPDTQAIQSTSVLVNPGSHTQAVSERLSAGELERSGHGRHAATSSDK